MAPKPEGISILGYAGANGTYFQLYSDERGVYRWARRAQPTVGLATADPDS